MSVAILDTGLSYENPSFIQEPQDQSRVAYTKEDIAAILRPTSSTPKPCLKRPA